MGAAGGRETLLRDRRGILTFVLASLLAPACGGGTVERTLSEPPPGRAGVVTDLVAADERDTACTPAPLAERAARVLLVGLPSVTAPTDPLVTEVLDAGVGGVLLTHANVESAYQVRRLATGIVDAAPHPVLVATDEEPGRVTSFSALFGTTPSARRLAAGSTVEEVADFARELGADLASVGITLNLAPVADLDDGPARALVGDRSFSADPTEAAAYSLAFAQGMVASGVTPVVKHFPGHGRSRSDTHVELATVDASLRQLRGSDLRPFVDAIEAGVPAVMVGHVTYTRIDAVRPASLSPAVYDLLRDLGFRGVAITDSIGMGAVNLRWDFDAAAVQAIAAGADGVLATDGRQAVRMRDALVAAVRGGHLPAARLDEAAARMAALAGDDPAALTCRSVALPKVRATAARATATAAAPTTITAAPVTSARSRSTTTAPPVTTTAPASTTTTPRATTTAPPSTTTSTIPTVTTTTPSAAGRPRAAPASSTGDRPRQPGDARPGLGSSARSATTPW